MAARRRADGRRALDDEPLVSERHARAKLALPLLPRRREPPLVEARAQVPPRVPSDRDGVAVPQHGRAAVALAARRGALRPRLGEA